MRHLESPRETRLDDLGTARRKVNRRNVRIPEPNAKSTMKRPVMLRRDHLIEDERSKRRSVADALDLLCRFAGFSAEDRAEIRVGPIKLPSGKVVETVTVVFDSLTREKQYVVSFPSATHFRAIRQGSSRREELDISLLDRATFAADRFVRLTDGTVLRAVEIIPARLPIKPSERDWRIVHHTIAILGEETRCYRNLRQGLPTDQQAAVPDLRFLDVSMLKGLKLPPLKEIAWRIGDRDEDLGKLSSQKIADALSAFGIRTPKARLEN